MWISRNQDVVVGGLLVGFALFGQFYLIPIGVNAPARVAVEALAPAFWPSIILWMTLILGGVLLAQGVFESFRRVSVVEEIDGGYLPAREAVFRLGVAVVFLFIYYFLIEAIGMVAASVLAILAFTWFSGERRYAFFVPVAILLPMALYYFFTAIAHVPLPLGYFELFRT